MFDENGQAMDVYGVASPKSASEWIFHDGKRGTTSDCKVYIRWVGDALTFADDPVATCADDGGYGTSVGYHRFPMKYYEKPVTWELRDEETAMAKSGDCWRHRTPMPPPPDRR